MNWRQGILITALLALATGLSAQQEAMEPLSEEEMAEAGVDEVQAAKDRDEVSKDEIEELQQYLRNQSLHEGGFRPPRQRPQEEDDRLTPFQQNFRDALIRASEQNRPPR